MKSFVAGTLSSILIGCSAVPKIASAGEGAAAQPAARICERDPTRPSCEVMGLGRTGPQASPGASLASPPKVAAPAATPMPVCERDPTRPSCEMMGRGPTQGSGRPILATPERREKAGRAAAAGGLSGAVLGLASCGPFLMGPPVYSLCAATGMLIGMLGGAAIGTIAGETAAAADSHAAGTPYTPAQSFAAAVQDAAQGPQHSAVAVLIGANGWAWGTAAAQETAEQAGAFALERCRAHAAQRGIAGECVLYSVNGKFAERLLQ